MGLCLHVLMGVSMCVCVRLCKAHVHAQPQPDLFRTMPALQMGSLVTEILLSADWRCRVKLGSFEAGRGLLEHTSWLDAALLLVLGISLFSESLAQASLLCCCCHAGKLSAAVLYKHDCLCLYLFMLLLSMTPTILQMERFLSKVSLTDGLCSCRYEMSPLSSAGQDIA